MKVKIIRAEGKTEKSAVESLESSLEDFSGNPGVEILKTQYGRTARVDGLLLDTTYYSSAMIVYKG